MSLVNVTVVPILSGYLLPTKTTCLIWLDLTCTEIGNATELSPPSPREAT